MTRSEGPEQEIAMELHAVVPLLGGLLTPPPVSGPQVDPDVFSDVAAAVACSGGLHR